MSSLIRIVEVGPRDGLQNEKAPVPIEVKLRLIRALAEAGLKEIEATSFVSPKWVPQLADSADLWGQLPPGPCFSALVPNVKGLENALKVGVDRIAVFTAASDAFTQNNINMTVDQSLIVFKEVVDSFRSRVPSGWVRGYVSTAFQCPYTGLVAPKQVLQVAERLMEIGVDEISIGDTVGAAVPTEVRELTRALTGSIPIDRIAYHFHDTNGTAIANVAQALDLGITAFDSSAAGLGGCPYAPGAAGNVATEDLVYLLERSGIRTGVDLLRLATSSLEVLRVLGRQPFAKGQLSQLSASETCPT